MNLLEQVEIEEFENYEKEAFAINDLETAHWAFKKIAALNSKIKEKEDLATAEVERIKQWLTDETKSDNESISYFESLLVQYYQAERSKDAKFKLSTPHGKVTSRKRQPAWTFDDDATIAYLEANNPDNVEIKKTFNKTEIKKMFKVADDKGTVVDENGEVVPFVSAVPQGDSYTVKAD